MAVEVEGSSQVEDFLGVLRRRVWWIAVPAIVISSLGVAAAVIVPKKYVASSQVLVRDVAGLISQNGSQAVSRMEGNVAPHVIRSLERVAEVLRNLNWEEYQAMTLSEQREYCVSMVEDLQIDLNSVQLNSGAQIVSLSYGNTSPQRAYDFLSKLVANWKSDVQGRFQRSERKMLEQLKQSEDALEHNMVKVSQDIEARKRANRIRPDLKLDPRGQGVQAGEQWQEMERLDTSIAKDIEEINVLTSQITRWRTEFNVLPPTKSVSEVLEVGGGVQLDIARFERRRQDLELQFESGGFTARNKEGQRIRAEIESITAQLAELRGLGLDGRRMQAEEVPNPERVALGVKIEGAERDLADLERRRQAQTTRRNELRLETDRLYREMEEIRRAETDFESLGVAREEVRTKRVLQESQVAMIESDAGKFFEDLRLPTVPTIPTKPDAVVIAVISTLLGVAFGFGLALLIEMSRSTFRSARDLTRVMAVPVLGTVNRIITRRQRARVIFARTALAVGTLSFVCVVGYVTWAWAYDREALSEPVLRAIEGLREPFL